MPPQAVSQITTVPHNSAKAASYSPPAVQSNRNSPTAANVVTDIGHIRGTIFNAHTASNLCIPEWGQEAMCLAFERCKMYSREAGVFLRAGFLLSQ